MKGLERIPAPEDLLGAYGRLQQGGEAPISVAEISLWARWSRFDPRLGEQLIEWLSTHWESVDALALNRENLRIPWPACLGVLLEFVRFMLESSAINAVARPGIFERWADLVMEGSAPAHHEQYFIGLARPGGKLMWKDAQLALDFYRRWGYLAREMMVRNKSLRQPPKNGITRISPSQRRGVLNELLRNMDRITVAQYREALEGWVSSRQAERDLEAHPLLKPRGRTRGRFYVRTARR